MSLVLPGNPGRIWISGELFVPAEAKVRVLEHGYLYGDGVFETLRTYGGVPFRLDAHLERLERALTTLRIEGAPSSTALAANLDLTLKAAGLAESYCRITVSRGLGQGLDPRTCGAPTVVIAVLPLRPYPAASYRDGVATIFLWTRAKGDQPPPSVKSTSYQRSVLARLALADRGAGEGFYLDADDNVTEGTVSNLFVAKDGALITPPTDVCLSGITRAEVLAIARGKGLTVREEPVSKAALFAADEAFVTSSLAELMPVTRIEGRIIGTGRPGPVHEALLAEYRERTDSFVRAPRLR